MCPACRWENLSSLWVVPAKRETALSFLKFQGSPWLPVVADPSARAWTEDYSDIFSAIAWHQRRKQKMSLAVATKTLCPAR